jgi:chemotaxis protein CheX
MSQSLQSVNISQFVTRHLIEVFETMLSKKAVPVAAVMPPHCLERVSGSVGFAGDSVNGAVYLHMSANFAARATAAILGLPPEQITGVAEVNDVVGEVTNMVAGGLKSALCDAGAPCAVSTPAIIRGTSFVVEPIPNVERFCVTFDCEGERFMAEVHIKYSKLDANYE